MALCASVYFLSFVNTRLTLDILNISLLIFVRTQSSKHWYWGYGRSRFRITDQIWKKHFFFNEKLFYSSKSIWMSTILLNNINSIPLWSLRNWYWGSDSITDYEWRTKRGPTQTFSWFLDNNLIMSLYYMLPYHKRKF